MTVDDRQPVSKTTKFDTGLYTEPGQSCMCQEIWPSCINSHLDIPKTDNSSKNGRWASLLKKFSRQMVNNDGSRSSLFLYLKQLGVCGLDAILEIGGYLFQN